MQNIIIEAFRSRRQFTVGVWPFDTIRQMKETIERSQDFPVASQTLFFRGHFLDDKQFADNYKSLFDDDDTDTATPVVVKLFVTPVPGMKLRVTFISAFPDVQFSLRHDLKVPLAALKKRIHELEGIPVERLAFFMGTDEVKDDSRSFADLGVTDHLEMGLEVRSMTIKIVGTSTEHFLNQDAREISVGGFREKIRASLGILADRQLLLFVDGCNRELREDHGSSLSDHGVTEDSVVNVVVNKPPGADRARMKIKIRKLGSSSFYYREVEDASEPVVRLRESIGKSQRIPASWIALFICGWELKDGWPLGYYGVVDSCSVVVTWTIKPVPGVAVGLKIKKVPGYNNDRPFFLFLDLTEPVGGVKERIGAKLRVPVERLKVSSIRGEELKDDGEALGYCVLINDPAVLSVVVKVRLTIQVPDPDVGVRAFDFLGDPTESVGELKKRAHETIGILANDDHQSTSLFIGDCELEDVRTLGSYGVTDGSVVKMQYVRMQ